MSEKKVKGNQRTVLKIRQRRIFSETFKREKVNEILSCEYSISSFCKLWDVSTTSVYRWIEKYTPEHKKRTTIVVQKDSEYTKTEELAKKVAKLEQALGQKQMQLDYLEKLIELASKEYDMDLKKNFNVKL